MTSELPFAPGTSVVAYLRDSGGSDQDLSVGQQENAVRAWCLEHGLQLNRVFHDDARPGSSVVGREQFQEMIRFFHHDNPAERGVILWKYSRFSRDIDDAQFFKADLRRLGYLIYSISDNIPDSADGRIYESLIDWMNSKFLLDLSSDVKRGLHHNFDQYGAMPGTPPRGFKREILDLGKRRDGSAHQVSRWVPDPETWQRCKTAWKMRAEGQSYRAINSRTQLYKSVNCYKTFFENRLYLGELHFGERVIEHYVEPMVDQGTWELVQRINQKNKVEQLTRPDNPQHPRRLGSSFLLSGLIYCSRCGAPMNGSVVKFSHDRKEFEYYICSRAGQTHECDARRIPRQTLETIVFKTLRDFVLDPSVVFQHQVDIVQNQDERKRELEMLRSDTQARLRKIQREIGNLNDVIAEEGKNTPRSTRERLSSLERDEMIVKAQLSNLVQQKQSEISTLTPEQARQIASHLQHAIETEGSENLKTMLFGIVQRICAERDGNVVRGMVYYYHPPETTKPPPQAQGGGGGGEFMRTIRCLHRDDEHTHKIYSIPFSTMIKKRLP